MLTSFSWEAECWEEEEGRRPLLGEGVAWQEAGGHGECFGGFLAEGERLANLSFRIIPVAPLTSPRGSIVPEANPVQHTLL